MPRPVRLILLGVIAALMLPVGPVGAAAKAPRFEAMPCPEDIFPPDMTVDCGFIRVPEDRAAHHGRTITVAAAVMRASTPGHHADPIVFLDGGPSFGAISVFAADAYFGGAPYAQDRDVVLVDTRGTGHSEPNLACPEIDLANVDAFYSPGGINADGTAIFKEAVSDCHDRLTGQGIDLAAYDTAESAADLDSLRQALGYRQWNLFALSADGVLGLTYMRLFPKGIRSAVIDSGASPQEVWDLDGQRGMAEELYRIFAGCAANAACNAAYPKIAKVFDAFTAKLNAHPVTISLPDFEPHPVTLELDGVGFFEDALGGIFPGNRFEGEHIHALLDEIWRSTHGELEAVYRERFGTGPVENDHANDFFAQGKTMSYVCHDLVGFTTKFDLRAAARDIPALKPYFLDPDYGLADGFTNPFSPVGCRIWDVGVADPIQHQPVSSDIPTLVLTGEFDTGVPPLIVRQIPPTLHHSYFFEFPASPHIQLASFNVQSDCARSIASAFLADPGHRPDATCIGSLEPFDFTP